MENKIITGLIAIVAIVVAVIFAGCTTPDTSDTSPSGVVDTFASSHRDEDFEACYSLMSTQYKNLTDEKAFRDKIKHCNDYYITDDVEDEEIEGDTASVKIEYVEQLSNIESKWYTDDISNCDRERRCKESKTLNLVKEEDGWKLAELYCELKSK